MMIPIPLRRACPAALALLLAGPVLAVRQGGETLGIVR